jgi:hypothetical protein
MPALAAAQTQQAMSQDAAFDEGVALVLDELRPIGSGATSARSKKVAALCCTGRYSMACSGRWRS